MKKDRHDFFEVSERLSLLSRSLNHLLKSDIINKKEFDDLHERICVSEQLNREREKPTEGYFISKPFLNGEKDNVVLQSYLSMIYRNRPKIDELPNH